MKYCILTTMLPEKKDYEAAGFYQWAEIHKGDIFQEREILHELKDGDFDMIHICLIPENLGLPERVRKRLGTGSKTAITVTVDIAVQSWKKSYHTYGRLKKDVICADVVFATEYTIATTLASLTGKRVYELAHPADIKRLLPYRGRPKKNYLTIIAEYPGWYYEFLILAAGLWGYKPRFLFSSLKDKNRTLTIPGMEKTVFNDDNELCEYLAESELIYAPYLHHNYGKLVVYAAAMGCLVIGSNRIDASRRCYPFTSYRPGHPDELAVKFFWARHDAGARFFFIENAMNRVEYYNWGNSRKRFFDLVYGELGDKRFSYKSRQIQEDNSRIIFFDRIVYKSGKKKVNYNRDELIVVCLVKNGMYYIDAFLVHYRKLGVKHFIFIDNGSDDGTINRLDQEDDDDVTIYTTGLAHKKYESEIRRTIIEEHCWGRWCLCVDIDELFDYPFSRFISIKQLLNYLDKNHYTSIIAYMLDMFSGELFFSSEQPEDLISQYPCYDLGNIKKENYYSHSKTYCNYNILADKKMKNYYGGIRRKFFTNRANKYLLIKHPLVFIDGYLEPLSDPHYCNKSHIADINGLLKHYKLTSGFKAMVEKTYSDYTYFAGQEYKTYKKILENKCRIRLSTPTISLLQNPDELIAKGFLRVSKQYKNYVRSEIPGIK